MEEFFYKYFTFFKIIFILISAFVVSQILRWVLNSYFKREASKINVDYTAYNFIKNAFVFVVWIIALFAAAYQIESLREFATAIFAGAGILAAIIGFASQAAFSNIINGIFIVMFKPFRIGDIIEIAKHAEYTGRVEDITLRHTVIKNFENKRVIVPNSVISSEIIVNRNIVDEKVIRYLDIPIGYKSDIDLAVQIIQEECENHPLFVDPRTEEMIADNEPKVEVRVMRLAENGIHLRAYVCGENSPESFVLLTDLYKIIKKRFDKEGVEIPLPYVNVIMKNNIQ